MGTFRIILATVAIAGLTTTPALAGKPTSNGQSFALNGNGNGNGNGHGASNYQGIDSLHNDIDVDILAGGGGCDFPGHGNGNGGIFPGHGNGNGGIFPGQGCNHHPPVSGQ
jgi:hypothetical protein